MCGYKVATNPQNFTEIYLAWVKILQKVWDYFYDSHCILPHIFSLIISIINPFRRSGDIITTKTLLRVCAARRVMTRVLKGSHVSFTCIPRVHPLTEWAIPAFAFPAEAGTHLPTPKGWKTELALSGWLVTDRNKCPATEIETGHGPHLSTNRAPRRLTWLIEANALTTTPDYHRHEVVRGRFFIYQLRRIIISVNTGWAKKTGPFFEVHNFFIYWHWKAFCISKCSALYPE